MERRFVKPTRHVHAGDRVHSRALFVVMQQVPPTFNPESHFDSGQDVVPSFDGWLHNPDGTYTMVFGYFNRNFKRSSLRFRPAPITKSNPGPRIRGRLQYFLPETACLALYSR